MTRPSSDRLVLANLIGLLAAAAFVRWLVLPIHGHGGDVAVVADWAERLAVRGPWNFYDGGFSIYPALLYLYWPFGVLFDNGVLEAYLKGQSILFDLAIGVVLFGIGRSWAGSSIGLIVAALYLFNPAVLLAGPIWGQIDAAGTLVMLGALMATAARRFGLAGSLAILAGLTKPQFGLVLLPVLAVAFLEPGSGNRWRPIGRALGGGLLTAVVVMLPLRLTPMKLFDQIASTAASKPITSANAFNPWGVFFGFSEPDGLLVWVGAAALLIGLGLALIPLWRRRDLATLLAVGVFLVFAFYFLPTRVHERYLFPVTALLAPLVYAAGSGATTGRLMGYLTLSMAFAAALIYALLDTTRFDLPPPLPDLWLSTPAIWLIGLTLMGSAVWWVWELNRPGSAVLAGDPGDVPDPLDPGEHSRELIE